VEHGACLVYGKSQLPAFVPGLAEFLLKLLFKKFKIELAVEREKRCIRTCSLHAEDAIDNVQVPFRKQSQGADEFLLILVCNALVVKDVDQALRRLILWHLIDLREDVNALGVTLSRITALVLPSLTLSKNSLALT
jgi:hypothetical protein